jgi:hypothetical protein
MRGSTLEVSSYTCVNDRGREGERERGREVSSYIWRDREIEKAREKRARLKGRQRNILF